MKGSDYANHAHASHDLNGISVIEITGWRGPHEVRDRGDKGTWVSIWAPKRHSHDVWTFQAPRGDGVLRCFTDLIGSPSLLTESAEPMEILMPADLIGSVTVRFAD